MSPSGQGSKSSWEANGRREKFDDSGCDVCGTHRASSFRRCPDTGCRLCNSCHCKMYRLKRKAAEAEMRLLAANSAGNSGGSPRRPRLRRRTAAAAAAAAAAAGEDASDTGSRSAVVDQQPAQQVQEAEQTARQQPRQEGARKQQQAQQQQQQQAQAQLTDTASHHGAPLPTPLQHAVATPTAHQAAGQPPQQQRHQQQQLMLADLQLKVLEDAGISGHPHTLAATLQSAHRAQAATPLCTQRAVLALLPRMKLHLASDPLGMEHDVSCLLEAVTPGAVPPEQEADSQAPQAPHQPQARPRWPATAGGAAVRLTVFAAAGAVPCWHEGPAEASISLGFNPLTKALSWSVPAFSLRFPGPTCPQVDLFTAVHQYIHSSRAAGLDQCILSLGPPPNGSTPPAPAPAQAPSAAARPKAAAGVAAATAAAKPKPKARAKPAKPRAAPPPKQAKPLPLPRLAVPPAAAAAAAAVAADNDAAPSLRTPSQGVHQLQPQPPSINSPEAAPDASEFLFGDLAGHEGEHWHHPEQHAHGVGLAGGGRGALASCLGLPDVSLDCPLLFDDSAIFDPTCFDSIFAGI